LLESRNQDSSNTSCLRLGLLTHHQTKPLTRRIQELKMQFTLTIELGNEGMQGAQPQPNGYHEHPCEWANAATRRRGSSSRRTRG
jgi:hypothetical protein